MSKKYIYYNGHKFCRDEKTGYYLSGSPLGKKNRRERLHRYIWECERGEIPEGYDIHHKDGNKYNNSINNLELILASEHIKIHAYRYKNDKKRIAFAIKNVREKALPKAIEWHRSEEGRLWHKDHGKKTWENRKTQKYQCMTCGKIFESKRAYSNKTNIFCGNNCRSKYRKQQGYDNVIKTCIICGSQYSINKYARTKTCSPACGRRFKSLNKLRLNQ